MMRRMITREKVFLGYQAILGAARFFGGTFVAFLGGGCCRMDILVQAATSAQRQAND